MILASNIRFKCHLEMMIQCNFRLSTKHNKCQNIKINHTVSVHHVSFLYMDFLTHEAMNNVSMINKQSISFVLFKLYCGHGLVCCWHVSGSLWPKICIFFLLHFNCFLATVYLFFATHHQTECAFSRELLNLFMPVGG